MPGWECGNRTTSVGINIYEEILIHEYKHNSDILYRWKDFIRLQSFSWNFLQAGQNQCVQSVIGFENCGRVRLQGLLSQGAGPSLAGENSWTYLDGGGDCSYS
jgi:hypothetical protein